MAERLTILSERVDDMPLLLAQLERMGMPPLLDDHFPTHGNWVGLSLGWVTVVWLTPILSQADHRLNHVEPWTEKRLHTLRGCMGQLEHPLDVSDDRLAAVLEALSDERRWSAFEGALTRQRRRVYDLPPTRGRVDRTTASGYWSVTTDGLLQCGHSKDHRPDWPPVKMMLSALDPLGWPLATDVVSGQRADDPLYVPAMTRVRASLGRRGLLYVGDGTMGAVETRAFLQAGGDDYLCPLSEIQRPPAILAGDLAPVWTGEQPVLSIAREHPDGTRALIAEGYERLEAVTAVGAGEPCPWTERRLVIRSRQLAQAGETARRARLVNAPAAVAALNARRRGKRRVTELPALQEAVAAILARDHVQGVLDVRDAEHLPPRPLRRYGSRPATARAERVVQVRASVDREALEAAVRQLGWRVYAANAPVDQLSLAQAVLASRHE